MPGGAFTAEVRAAIFDAHLGTCVGCGRKATDTHHRAARRAGGTSNASIGAPYNGIGLDRTCHMWAEAHPVAARRLGWIIDRPNPGTPYWTSLFGWCSWVLLTDGPPCWCVRPCLNLPPPSRGDLP